MEIPPCSSPPACDWLSLVSIDAQGRFCADCGRSIVNAARVYNGDEYCRTCYKREFRAMTCAVCGTVSRHHRDHPGPYACPQCTQRTRTCARCDRPVPRAARVLKDGQVICPSCVSYYREPAACATCGRISTRLARMPKYGALKAICERCQGRLTNRTCSVCHRFRPIIGNTSGGKPFCRACNPAAPQSHPCSGCGVLLPGNGNGRCRSCLAKKRLLRTASVTAAAMGQTWSRWLVTEYAHWLASTRAECTTIVQKFLGHVQFFEHLEKTFTALSDVTAVNLLSHMRASELRRFQLPMTFLRECIGLVLNPASKEVLVENGRINAIIMRTRGEDWGTLLAGYREWLESEQMIPRTRRLLLRAAEAFCQSQKVDGNSAWSAQAIPTFLRRSPGHRASLFKFVTYVRSQFTWVVSMPRAIPRSRPPRTIHDLDKLMRRVMERGVDVVPIRDLTRIIAKALGYRVAQLHEGSWSVHHTSDDVHLRHNDETILIPSALAPVVEAWGRRR